MPTPRPGPDKFGIEHKIKNDPGKDHMTDKEFRKKADHYIKQ